MLTSLLVWVVLLGSIGIYLLRFFLPELHQKNDVIWSGIGLFYGLMLALYADQIRGGLLLGQTAGVTMLLWFGWQTYALRRATIPLEQRTTLPDISGLQNLVNPVISTIKGWLTQLEIPFFQDQASPAQPQNSPPIPEVSPPAEPLVTTPSTVDVPAPSPDPEPVVPVIAAVPEPAEPVETDEPQPEIQPENPPEPIPTAAVAEETTTVAIQPEVTAAPEVITPVVAEPVEASPEIEVSPEVEGESWPPKGTEL
jgi:Ycf66 protein N-terminus